MFGYRRIHSNTVSDRKDDPESAVFKIYGETLRRVKVAYLSTGNGVGFEIFEFVDSPYKKSDNFDYTRGYLSILRSQLLIQTQWPKRSLRMVASG